MALTIHPDALMAAFRDRLQAGESLQYALYGQQISVWPVLGVILACAILAGISTFLVVGLDPGTFGFMLFPLLLALLFLWPYMKLRKDNLLGLTDRRLLLIRIKTPLLSFDLQKQVGMKEWPIGQLPPVSVKVGKIRTLIRVQDAGKSMLIKVPYAGQSGAKSRAEGMREVLTARAGATHS